MASDTRRKVVLRVGTNADHYQQIFTGFAMLARQGLIDLSCEYKDQGVFAQVSGKTIYYDVGDGHRIEEEALVQCDVYRKRSFSAELCREIDGAEKIKPLGLNYEVYPDFVSWHEVKRNYLMARGVGQPDGFLGGFRRTLG